MAYPFLSDEWIDEARRIREELGPSAAQPPLLIRANVVVTGLPWTNDRLDAHIDSRTGVIDLEVGHLANPDVTVTLEYPTARAVFVEGDVQGAMQAFLSGRIKVDGDITKLLAIPGAGEVDPVVVEAYQRLRALTE